MGEKIRSNRYCREVETDTREIENGEELWNEVMSVAKNVME